MLLVHPVNELVKFLPVLVGIFVLGSTGNGLWQLSASPSRSPSASCAS